MGTSLYSFCGYTGRQDHPHACGDKKSITIIKKKVRGSSPRVWGQVVVAMPAVLVCGIIPTRVGTSRKPCDLDNICKDHPHACGDKANYAYHPTHHWGSFPRVWGQGFKEDIAKLKVRIIPTRVGTSYSGLKIDDIFRDHPHACGDK